MIKEVLHKHVCPVCNHSWLSSSTVLYCGNCACVERWNKLPTPVILDVDVKIFVGKILQGIAMYKQSLNCNLHEALDVYYWRYKQLRTASPEKFLHSEEEYWEGFYS